MIQIDLIGLHRENIADYKLNIVCVEDVSEYMKDKDLEEVVDKLEKYYERT